MMEANASMLEKKAELRSEAAQHEALLLAKMRMKFAQDEAIERQQETMKRHAKEQHMSLINKQARTRKELYDHEQHLEKLSLKEQLQREQYRKHVIAEARRRLLEEHAGRLAGYMPGNILKNAEDAALFKRLATKPREFEYIL